MIAVTFGATAIIHTKILALLLHRINVNRMNKKKSLIIRKIALIFLDSP